MRLHRVGVRARHRQHRRVELRIPDARARKRLVGRLEQTPPRGPHSDRVLIARAPVADVQRAALDVQHSGERLGRASVDTQQEELPVARARNRLTGRARPRAGRRG